MKIMLDKGAKCPTRAHPQDAGLDLYSPIDIAVEGFGHAVIDTGVHVDIPAGYVGLLMSKSGLNVRHSITSEGVIDEGYTGSIVVKLYNHRYSRYCVCKGDKISQLLIVPVLKPELEIVYALDETERGDKGFGSTGR